MRPNAFRRVFAGLTRRLGLEPGEGRLLVLMGTLVAVLLCAYTIAKVLRDALFLKEFGALALPYAYIAVAFASAGYVWLESIVARRFKQIGASRFNQYAAIGCSILAAAALPRARQWTIALFYLWTGSQALMLLPHFWGLALDVWNSRRVRLLFPILSGCGLLGGLAGGGIAASSAPRVRLIGLMWVVSGLLIIARILTGFVERRRALSPEMSGVVSNLSSWEIVRKSGYIKVLALGLALSVVVGTLVDFQFKLLILRMYPEPQQLAQFLGKFYVGLNAVSLLFQFGLAGWLLQRLGLGASTGLQPGAVLAFAAWAGLTTGGGAIVAMRWIQGVISQTLGKSSTEIYYAAIHPKERRRIKPAIDTLVERWSDAIVGVLLVVVLRLLHAPIAAITITTGALAAVWLAVLFVLNRQYGLAFHEALSRRWIEPEAAPESMRLPAARKALLAALRSDDERQVLLALKLSEHARDGELGSAVRGCLLHPSPGVRAAAVEAMGAMRLPDPERVVFGLLAEPHEGLRRAAIRYLLTRGEAPIEFARRLLDGGDATLREYLLDALSDHPSEAPGVLTWEWIDARLASGTREDLLLAARALSAMEDTTTRERLRSLLTNPDVEIQRVALLSAARRPSRELLDVLLPLLIVSELSSEARHAVAAIGDPAVPELARLLSGERGERAQARAARALTQIATPRALTSLMTLVRSGDVRLRYLGLQGMARVRLRTGAPVLPRSTVHRLFLRELREYRVWMEPVASLATNASPEVRLLGESYHESAVRALDRGLRALSCWYDPKPLVGVFDRIKSGDLTVAAPALEYLGQVLPGAVFRPVSKIFEAETLEAREGLPVPDRLAEWIQIAWETGDAWLRACAVRASRWAPTFDPGRFATGDGGDPMVRAELEALTGGGRSASEPRPC
jgi:ATP/ADP translocase/HEAT repeat protein